MNLATKSWRLSFVQDCNLRCDYCATLFGSYGGSRRVLPERLWQPLLALMAARLPADRTITLEFGGGETFFRYDVFLRFLGVFRAWADELQVRYKVSVQTNGTTLDREKIDDLVALDVALFFSLDGPARVHDQHRHAGNGGGSHAFAHANWLYYTRNLSAEERGRAVAAVYTDDTDLASLSDYFRAQGAPLFRCMVQLHPMRPSGAELAAWNVRQERYLADLEILARRQCAAGLERLLSEYSGPFDLYQLWTSALTQTSRAFCGAGRDILSVSADGAIYPCADYHGSRRYRLGNLDEGLEQAALDAYVAATVDAKRACLSCANAALCPKCCFAQYPERTPAENVADGCGFGRKLSTLAQETWASMLETSSKAQPS